MSLLGILARAITAKERDLQKTTDDYNRDRSWNEQTGGAGILPRSYDQDFTAPTPPVTPQESPGKSEPVLPFSGRTAEPPYQPASSSIGSTVVQDLVRPREVDPPKTESERLQRDYVQARQPAEDRNGRVNSAIWNAFSQMGEQANRALASGRPVDEYALASIAGRGIGGAARGAFDPSVDENVKRRTRMADLEHQIGVQLKLEQEAAEQEKLKVDTEYQRQRPELERLGIKARSRPKPFVIAGKRINYRLSENGEDWEPYEETVKDQPIAEGEKALVDTSKAPDQSGLLPSQKLRATLTREEIQARSDLADKNNKFKAGENEKDRTIKRAELSERIAARLEKDKQARVSAGQAVTRIKISLANAKIEAEKWGVNVDDYIDALSDNGVEVTNK